MGPIVLKLCDGVGRAVCTIVSDNTAYKSAHVQLVDCGMKQFSSWNVVNKPILIIKLNKYSW